jgi:hypothetical protein
MFIMLCVFCQAATVKFAAIFKGFQAEILPSLADTPLILRPGYWMLACPLPWLVWLIWLGPRRELSRRTMPLFIGSMTVAGVILVGIVWTVFYRLTQFGTIH